MPRPTRFFECFCPPGGCRSLRFIITLIRLFDDRQQMRNLFNHPPKSGSIRRLNHLVDLPHSKAAENHLMVLRSADGTAHQLDLDFGFHNYDTFSTARPRISSITVLSRNCSSATTVAFTTLCGLCVPIDLVSTLGMPTA